MEDVKDLLDQLPQGAVILYMKSRPLPSLRDFGDVGVCVHLVIYQEQQQQLAAEQPLCDGSWYGPPITIQIITPHPPPSARQGRTPCLVDSLQLLASVADQCCSAVIDQPIQLRRTQNSLCKRGTVCRHRYPIEVPHKVSSQSTTMYVPSSELGLSQPLSRQRVCPSPKNGGGGKS